MKSVLTNSIELKFGESWEMLENAGNNKFLLDSSHNESKINQSVKLINV